MSDDRTKTLVYMTLLNEVNSIPLDRRKDAHWEVGRDWMKFIDELLGPINMPVLTLLGFQVKFIPNEDAGFPRLIPAPANLSMEHKIVHAEITGQEIFDKLVQYLVSRGVSGQEPG